MKLYDLLKLGRRNVLNTNKDFGIEIEVEGRSLPNVESKYWESKDDHSLRGESREYISNGPQYYKDLIPALDELKAAFHENGSKLQMSFRTSVHVHINMTQQNIDQIQAMIYLYLLYEDAFLNYAGEERNGNRFCLGFKDAEGLVQSIIDLVNVENIHRIDGNQLRYASLNIASLNQFGTLEFRALRGTIDSAIIQPWVGMLIGLRSMANVMGSASSVYRYLMELGIEKFTKNVFGQWLNIFRYPNMYQDLDYNTSLLLQLPFELKKEPEDMKMQEAPKAAQIKKAARVNLGVPANVIQRLVVNDHGEVERQEIPRDPLAEPFFIPNDNNHLAAGLNPVEMIFDEPDYQ